MANNIELITKYSTKAWDKVYKAEARSSLLDGNQSNVQWTGAKTVKIAKFNAGGLKNYYRNNEALGDVSPFGYQTSNVGLTWQERTVRQDRAAKYQIELFDNEETDGLTIGAATTEISRTIMIPEIDAYCFSQIVAEACSEAEGNLVKAAVTKANALEELNKALLYLDEHEVPAENQVIFVSPKYMNYLRNDNTELARYLMQSDYSKDVKFTLTSYEGREFAVVPPQRFRTAFSTVTASGSGYTFGYNGDDGIVTSDEINFIVLAKDAVIHVVKYNKVKVLSGDVVLAGGGFDGYMLFARVYHDLFVFDNKKYAVYACLNNGSDKTTIPAATATEGAPEVETSKTAALPKK